MSEFEAFHATGGSWKSFQDGSTAGEPTSGQNVLLLTEFGNLTATGDQELHDILVAEGYNVVVRSPEAEEDYTGVGVVVAAYGNPQGETNQYLHPPVGFVGIDSWRVYGMGDTLGYQNTITQVEVVDAASPLAAGVSGTFDAYVSGEYITWELNLAPAADVIVTRPSQSSQAVVFAYEAGSEMLGRFATTRHVGMGYHRNGFATGLTENAKSQLLAAISWALNSSYVAPPPPQTPTGLTASGRDSSVSLAWSSSLGATSYRVKRSLSAGGPYTVIQTGVTSTSYIDYDVVNGTTYYYVVSAENAAGESADSTESSATPDVSSNLSLLVTSAEISMWQSRKVSGPFKSTGDFSTNSPGHWDEMNAAMSLNFSSSRWQGPPHVSNGRVLRADETIPGSNPPRDVGTENDPAGSVRLMASDMMSAAYAAVTTSNVSVASSIVEEIEYQATRSKLDYSNRTLWPLDYYDDINPMFMHCLWVIDYIVAYDACKSMGVVSSSQQDTIESWFISLAELAEDALSNNLGAQLPNRKSNSYNSRGSAVDEELYAAMRNASGTALWYPRIILFYNNRRNDQATLCGLAGMVASNQYFINEFKRYVREWVMFGNSLETQSAYHFGDVNRGRSDLPQLGLSYHINSTSRMLLGVDALARQGDTSLYDFSSSEGSANPSSSTNHSKSFEDCLNVTMGYVNQTLPAFYTGGGSYLVPPPSDVTGDEFHRVKTRNAVDGRELSADSGYLLAASYYDRSDWQDIINRVGTPTGFTNPPWQAGAVWGWRADRRQRFLRSLDANPYGA